jgi:Tfp pilus assembly protein FimT
MSKAKFNVIIFLIILLILSVGLSLYLGFRSIHNNIADFEQKHSDKESIKTTIHESNGPLLIDLSNVDSLGNVTFEENDIQNINSHIKYLTAGLEDEYIKTQELIDSDIDRIGIMMTITIGVLTLLLGVLPFLSNLITRQDMRSEVEKLSQSVGSAEESAKTLTGEMEKVKETAQNAQSTATTANTSADNANKTAKGAQQLATKQEEKFTELKKSTDSLSKQVKDKLPKATVMSVHVAISRLINVTNHVQNGSGTVRAEYLTATVKAISGSIENCKNENIIPSEEGFLKTALTDLYFSLENWPFAIALYGRKVYELKSPWMDSVYILIGSSEKNYEKNYSDLLNVLEQIILELENFKKVA